MKRALLLFALLSVPVAADAKVAIVRVRQANWTQSSATYVTKHTDLPTWNDWTVAHVVGFMNRYGRTLGTDYDIYRSEQVKLSRCSAGGGTACAAAGSINGIDYDAVIWVLSGLTLSTQGVANCAPCSLTLVARLPTVPQLFIHDGQGEGPSGVATTCSLGFVAQLDPASQGPSFGDGVLFIPGQDYKFHRAWDVGSMASATPYSHGFRTILGFNNATTLVDRDSVEGVTFTLDRYGVTLGAYDTTKAVGAHVMAKLNQNKSGAAQNIFVHWATSAPTRMAGPASSTEEHPMASGDPFPIYFGLAYLDSLTNHAVLGTDDPEPVKFAVQVEGLAARSSASNDGGMLASDSTVVYAGLDSLRVLDFPLVFGVNADSAGTYQRDINLATALRRARFTPWIRTGVDTAVLTAANGGASYLHVVDMLGRYRNRTFYRPHTATAGDTSLRNLAQWAKWRVDSIVGGQRLSSVIMAPADDWSPKNITEQNGNVDSLAIGLAAAGFTGISFNVEADTINKTVPTNPVGVRIEPQFRRDHNGRPFGFLAYTRMGNRGSGLPWIAGASDDQNHLGHNIRRLWMSAYTGSWNEPIKPLFPRSGGLTDWAEPHAHLFAYATISPYAVIQRPVNILRLSMAGLGSGSTGTSAPTRPDWYAAKTLVNQVRALNHIAGRTLAQIVYPEQIGPQDLH